MVTSEGAVVDAEVAQKPQRSRLGCILRTLGCGCGTIVLLALLAGGIGAWRYRQWRHGNEQYVERELARIRAAGEPMSVAELYAWHRVPEGKKDLTADWTEALAQIRHAYDKEQLSVREEMQRFALERYGQDDKPLTVDPDLARFLERLEPEISRIIGLARQDGATAYPRAFEETMRAELNSASNLRVATNLMCASAKACLARDEHNKAAERFQATLDMIGTLDRAPSVIEHLVALRTLEIAENAIVDAANRGALATAEIESLAARLGRFDLVESRRIALIGERAVIYLVMTTPGEAMRTGNKTPEHVNGPAAQAVAGQIDRATGLRWTGQLIELAGADYATSRQGIHALEMDSRRLRVRNEFEMLHNVYTLLLVPALFKTQETSFRDESRRRVVVAGLLALVHRQRHGEWPSSVVDLDFGADTKGMLDPYVDAPLRLMAASDGLKIYSVGPNQVDDGGIEQEKGGTPSGEPDIVVSVRHIEAKAETPVQDVSP